MKLKFGMLDFMMIMLCVVSIILGILLMYEVTCITNNTADLLFAGAITVSSFIVSVSTLSFIYNAFFK